jgi:hypothetical protein
VTQRIPRDRNPDPTLADQGQHTTERWGMQDAGGDWREAGQASPAGGGQNRQTRTILAWYSGLLAKNFDNSQERRSPGRPAIERDREASVVRMVGGFIRRWVSDGACCHGLRKQKSRAAECAAENAARCRGRSRGSLPGKAVEQDSHREGALRCGHFRGRIRAQGPDCFALGIPAAVDGCQRRTLARSSASCPPLAELLAPPCTLTGTADANMGPPRRRLSMGSHDHLLLEHSHHLLSAVGVFHRLRSSVRREHRTIQRIIVM